MVGRVFGISIARHGPFRASGDASADMEELHDGREVDIAESPFRKVTAMNSP
jgi:hypothetical protein